MTIVEIIKKDNINEDYFLLPNNDYNISNYKKYIGKKIYITQFPKGEFLCHSNGEIKKIQHYEFSYNASTKQGSSGSPIFLINTTRVIGIHKQGDRDNIENYGDFIFPIIEFCNNIKKSNDKVISENSTNYEN